MSDWKCEHAPAGCNYPEAECTGQCDIRNFAPFGGKRRNMNEQDKQACKDAKLQNLVDLKPLTFDTGWQAALEYARGKQEPVAWMYPDEPYFDGNKWVLGYGTTPSKTTAQWRANGKEITPLYTHPAPAVAVNEQMLEALKAYKQAEQFEGSLGPEKTDQQELTLFSLWSKAENLRDIAIAAAEAAKEKQQ